MFFFRKRICSIDKTELHMQSLWCSCKQLPSSNHTYASPHRRPGFFYPHPPTISPTCPCLALLFHNCLKHSNSYLRFKLLFFFNRTSEISDVSDRQVVHILQRPCWPAYWTNDVSGGVFLKSIQSPHTQVGRFWRCLPQIRTTFVLKAGLLFTFLGLSINTSIQTCIPEAFWTKKILHKKNVIFKIFQSANLMRNYIFLLAPSYMNSD